MVIVAAPRVVVANIMSEPGRVFAVLPAAGASQRMRTQKLLLPWGATTVLNTVLRQWTSSMVERVVVVIRREEPRLLEICHGWDVDVVEVDKTPEMKDTIRLALDWISTTYAPESDDAWMLAPADMPRIRPELISAVATTGFVAPQTITRPQVGRRKGHPVFFPWSCATEVAELAEGQGVNAIVNRQPCRHVDTVDQGALQDLDTPEQYARLRPYTPSDES